MYNLSAKKYIIWATFEVKSFFFSYHSTMNEAFFEYINVLLQDNFFVKVYIVFSEVHCLWDIKIQEYSHILSLNFSLYIQIQFSNVNKTLKIFSFKICYFQFQNYYGCSISQERNSWNLIIIER